MELDPRNFQHLVIAGAIYKAQHRYPECLRLFERALALQPRDLNTRLLCAHVPFEARADLRPLQAEYAAISPEEFKTVKWLLADQLRCALALRDRVATTRALSAIPPEGIDDPAKTLADPREWFAGLAARAFGDRDAARVFFTAARAKVEKLLLTPLSSNALEGTELLTNLAVVYAWVGEKDQALAQLALSARLPYGLHDSGLKLDRNGTHSAAIRVLKRSLPRSRRKINEDRTRGPGRAWRVPRPIPRDRQSLVGIPNEYDNYPIFSSSTPLPAGSFICAVACHKRAGRG